MQSLLNKFLSNNKLSAMTATSHSVQFFEASCDACRHRFSMPLLSDFSYGEFILHGERQTIFGFLSAHDEPAWDDIEGRLRRAGLFSASATRLEIDRFQRVIAASADTISGERLVLFPVCPSCGSRSLAYDDSKPQGIRDVPRVTFGEYQLLSDEMRTQKVTELWRQFT
jgi:hypothetical protein